MCLGPLAYGHATATKIFLGFSPLTGANDREWTPGHSPRADRYAAEHQRGQQGDRGEEREVS